MTRSLEDLIDAYCAAWSEVEPRRREQLLDDVWEPDATYTDPRVHARGIAALSSFIGKVLAGRPGARVVRTSAVDAHHDLARFTWRVVQPDGAAVADGIDFAEISPGGKLQRIVGFYGPLATAGQG